MPAEHAVESRGQFQVDALAERQRAQRRGVPRRRRHVHPATLASPFHGAQAHAVDRHAVTDGQLGRQRVLERQLSVARAARRAQLDQDALRAHDAGEHRLGPQRPARPEARGAGDASNRQPRSSARSSRTSSAMPSTKRSACQSSKGLAVEPNSSGAT